MEAWSDPDESDQDDWRWPISGADENIFDEVGNTDGFEEDTSANNVIFKECKLKLEELREEPVYNPWSVKDPSVFLRYHCPQCPLIFKKLEKFARHSLKTHPYSKMLFRNTKPNQLHEVFWMVEKEIKTKSSQKLDLPDEDDFTVIAQSIVNR